MTYIAIIITLLGISFKILCQNSKIQRVQSKNTGPEKPLCRKHGEELYLKQCSICHGRLGDGKGILDDSMSPKPTNFLKQSYSKEDAEKDLMEIVEVLKNGIPKTSMGKFTHILKTKKDLECTAQYVQSLKKIGD